MRNRKFRPYKAEESRPLITASQAWSGWIFWRSCTSCSHCARLSRGRTRKKSCSSTSLRRSALRGYTLSGTRTTDNATVSKYFGQKAAASGLKDSKSVAQAW